VAVQDESKIVIGEFPNICTTCGRVIIESRHSSETLQASEVVRRAGSDRLESSTIVTLVARPEKVYRCSLTLSVFELLETLLLCHRQIRAQAPVPRRETKACREDPFRGTMLVPRLLVRVPE
jgi:hypothetical protein